MDEPHVAMALVKKHKLRPRWKEPTRKKAGSAAGWESFCFLPDVLREGADVGSVVALWRVCTRRSLQTLDGTICGDSPARVAVGLLSSLTDSARGLVAPVRSIGFCC